MAGYPNAIIHQVTDLKAAEQFLREVVGLPVRARGDGWVLLDNQTVAIRLLKGSATGRMRIELESNDPEADAEALLCTGKVKRVGNTQRVTYDLLVLPLAGPCGIELQLVRQYSEDETGIVPELETSLDWAREASDALRRLLRWVPLPFRCPARAKSVQRAEELALQDGRVSVDLLTALRALVQITPSFKAEVLREQITGLGLDVAPLEPEFARQQGGDWAT